MLPLFTIKTLIKKKKLTIYRTTVLILSSNSLMVDNVLNTNAPIHIAHLQIDNNTRLITC